MDLAGVGVQQHGAAVSAAIVHSVGAGDQPGGADKTWRSTGKSTTLRFSRLRSPMATMVSGGAGESLSGLAHNQPATGCRDESQTRLWTKRLELCLHQAHSVAEFITSRSSLMQRPIKPYGIQPTVIYASMADTSVRGQYQPPPPSNTTRRTIMRSVVMSICGSHGGAFDAFQLRPTATMACSFHPPGHTRPDELAATGCVIHAGLEAPPERSPACAPFRAEPRKPW